MSSAKLGNKIFIILILLMLALAAVSAAVFLCKGEKKENVDICDSNFHFEDFSKINPSHERTKNVSDQFLSELVSLNGVDGVEQFCASAIKGKDNCIQYFQPKASAGGDVHICVNPKTKTLVSVKFGE